MAFSPFSDIKKISPRKSLLIALSIFVSVPVFAKTKEPLSSWLNREKTVAVKRMFANISPKGGALGAVAASPSRENPDYWYHWIRDAAITMNELVYRLEGFETPEERQIETQMLKNYAAFSVRNQKSKAKTGLGEPKFNMNGSPFNGPWARPQNDGPALRAITFLHWASLLEKTGNKKGVLALYDPKFPQNSLIGRDLDYISTHWKQPCYDLWEESFGFHFFTQMLERKALLKGSRLAQKLGDFPRALFYKNEAKSLELEIAKHWNSGRGFIMPTVDQTNMRYKNSGLDSSVILAVLMGNTHDGFFAPEDDRVLATALAIENVFKKIYPINWQRKAPGIAIGRYPEDRYNGTNVFKPDNGNPWVLNTEAFSQFYWTLAADYSKKGSIALTPRNLSFFKALPLKHKAVSVLKAGEVLRSPDPLFQALIAALRHKGDSFMAVVRRYANPDGTLSEQIDRKTGRMVSAQNLTWNYAGFLSQDRARH
jgi:glucoamylase